MKENAIITIQNQQSGAFGEDSFSLSTVGQFNVEDNRYIISYQDSDATGFDGCETTLSVEPDLVMLRRTGKYEANLLLQPGVRNTGHYVTAMGDLPLGVTADTIEYQLTENGGTLDLRYTLDINSSYLLSNQMSITIREREHDQNQPS